MKELHVHDRLKCVAAVLLNPKGELLLQQRDERLDAFPLHWAPFGGRVGDKETPEEAMRRELLEKAALPAPPLTLWKTHEHLVELNPELVIPVEEYLFVGRTTVDIARIDLREGTSVGFFSREQLADLPIAFRFREILEEFFSHWEA
jgi:8-oxo-dGTP pyrophosphatase MutT (NUDIX family)